MQKVLNISVLQFNPLWQAPTENFRLIDSLIPSGLETDLLLLPEMFSTGFTMNPSALPENHKDICLSWMNNCAHKLNAAIAGSIAVKDEDGKYYNRLYFVTSDGHSWSYNKRHLFMMEGEERSYSPGMSRLIVNYKGWRICPLICFDLRFPVWSRNRNDYDLLLYHACWPEARDEVWTSLLKARAIENQCYCVGVNRTGTDGNHIKYQGNSIAFDAKGFNFLSLGNKTNILKTVGIEADTLLAFREKFPVLHEGDAFTLNT